MKYRVILLQNGKFKKYLHKCKRDQTSRLNFKKILEENNEIKLPRKFLTSDNISPVLYEVCRVKEFEPNDLQRVVKDKMGRLVKPRVLMDRWTVLDWDYFDVEETFYVYGYDPVSDRKDFNFILGLLVKAIANEKITKDIIILHNKIFIYNEYQFSIIICKCKKDAIRLYNQLLSVAQDNKLRRLLFMGHASEKMVGELYKMMMEHTGWNYRKVSRISTNT